LKNITRTLILAGLIGPLAHPLAAQVRSSVSYDYQYVSDFEGCQPQHAHGVELLLPTICCQQATTLSGCSHWSLGSASTDPNPTALACQDPGYHDREEQS